MEANGRLPGSIATNACAWSMLPRGILRVWRLANGRLERLNNRGPWRQTAGFKALTTNACRQSAWLKLLRGILRGLEANGRLQGSNNKCLSPEVEAAAGDFKGLKPGKRQAWTPYNNRGPWRQTAGFKALTTHACRQSAWSKLPRGILRVWRLANGRLERLSNRGPWRQTAGFIWFKAL